MRSIYDILIKEGILDNPEKSMSKGEAALKKEVLTELKGLVRAGAWYSYADNELYNKIITVCEQLPDADKKGTRWQLIMPDSNSNFKPIFVAMHKGLFRYTKGAEKELYGTTASAMHKRNLKTAKTYQDEKLSKGWINSRSIVNLAFLMNEYTKVDSISGGDWYSIAIHDYTKSSLYTWVSYNPTSKEWCYGRNNEVPSFVNDHNANKFFTVSSIMLRDELHKSLYLAYMSYIMSVLPHGDANDFKKTSKYWLRVEFSGDSMDNYKTKCLYVHKTKFVYLTQEDIQRQSVTGKIGTAITNEIQKEIEYVKNTRMPNPSINMALHNYIKSNFTAVSNSNYDTSKKWYKVHGADTDSKYGAYMVCFDTQEYRPTTHDEF